MEMMNLKHTHTSSGMRQLISPLYHRKGFKRREWRWWIWSTLTLPLVWDNSYLHYIIKRALKGENGDDEFDDEIISMKNDRQKLKVKPQGKPGFFSCSFYHCFYVLFTLVWKIMTDQTFFVGFIKSLVYIIVIPEKMFFISKYCFTNGWWLIIDKKISIFSYMLVDR